MAVLVEFLSAEFISLHDECLLHVCNYKFLLRYNRLNEMQLLLSVIVRASCKLDKYVLCEDVRSHGRAVKEWLMPLSSGELGVARYDSVVVQSLSWEIPSLEHLWLGKSIDDKHMRMMVLLRCFNCYDGGDSLLLNQTYVQPRFLILCLVLR